MACEEKNYWYTAQPHKGQGVYGIRRSKGFTGAKNGKLFYRGAEWTGPTNLIGRPDLAAQQRKIRAEIAAERAERA